MSIVSSGGIFFCFMCLPSPLLELLAQLKASNTELNLKKYAADSYTDIKGFPPNFPLYLPCGKDRLRAWKVSGKLI